MHFELLYMQVFCFGLLIVTAYFGGKLSHRLRLGEVIGQVVGGLVVGPVILLFLEQRVPAYRQALHSLHFLTFVFLSVIAFSLGDELSGKKIQRIGKSALIICAVQALITWLLVTVTFLLLGFKPTTALIIGSIGIATAPASTFVIMNRLGIEGKMRSMLGGIVVLDDVLEVAIFSLAVQVALVIQKGAVVSVGGLVLPVAKEFALALLLGFGIFIILKIVLERRWLRPGAGRGRSGPVLGPEFLSRLVSEMPGPSMETFIIIWGCVCLGIGLALHWELPFLITAVSAGILMANLHTRGIFESLRIENATPLFTLIFFALIGANARIEAFHPENFLYVGAYIATRAIGKIGGTWIACRLTRQEKRLTQCLPKLMLPQAGVAAVEAFFVATVLGAEGEAILGIILPGLIVFETVGVFVSERALMKWRSWATGGGELIDEAEIFKDKLRKENLNIAELIRPECLRVPLEVSSKGEAIWEMIRTLQSEGFIYNPGGILEIILQRERQGGTTLGEGISILHGRIPGLREPAVALGVLPRDHGIDFGGRGETPVDIIYLVLSPSEKPELHLQILAAIAAFLSNCDLRTRLRSAGNEHDAMEIIREHSK